MGSLFKRVRGLLGSGPAEPAVADFPHLLRNTLEVRSYAHLKKAFGWQLDPIFSDESLHRFDYLLDINDRRIRDAEVLLGACRNLGSGIFLEIGTSHGRSTASMSENAPDAHIYTVNIPPEEIAQGGKAVTFAPSRDEIGHVYRDKGCQNITQILANTATWEPDFGPIRLAFIDGCHDAEFVYNDTRKILKQCQPGSFLLWHDFCPPLAPVYPWIASVCEGVERLLADGLIKGNVLHLQDSWVGLHRLAPP